MCILHFLKIYPHLVKAKNAEIEDAGVAVSLKHTKLKLLSKVSIL